jgi:hypothetical protein
MSKFEKRGQIEAEISWPKLFSFNKDTKYNPDGEYSCQAIVSKETRDRLVNEFKITPSRIKDLGNGSYEFKFKRKHKMNDDWILDAPLVFDFEAAKVRMEAEEGNDINRYLTKWNPDEDGLIGNGTKAKISFRVYKGPNSPSESVTLEAVGVTSLVSYSSGATTADSGPRF